MFSGFSIAALFLRESLTPYILISLLSKHIISWTLDSLSCFNFKFSRRNKLRLAGTWTPKMCLLLLLLPSSALWIVEEDKWRHSSSGLIKSHLHSQTKNKSVFHCDCIKGKERTVAYVTWSWFKFLWTWYLWKAIIKMETMVIIFIWKHRMGPHYILVSDSGEVRESRSLNSILKINFLKIFSLAVEGSTKPEVTIFNQYPKLF